MLKASQNNLLVTPVDLLLYVNPFTPKSDFIDYMHHVYCG